MFSCFKKPRKPRARKFHSVHGRARADKPVPQRKVSLQEKLEEKVTLETAPSSGVNSTVIHTDEVDHVSSKSPSKSPSRDMEERSSPVGSDKPVENGENGALTTAEPVKPVEPVTQPQPNTSSSTSKGTYTFTHLNNQNNCMRFYFQGGKIHNRRNIYTYYVYKLHDKLLYT